MNSFKYTTSIGNIIITADDFAITQIKTDSSSDNADLSASSKLTDLAAKQIDEYLAGVRKEFDLPLRPVGTAFQQSAWNALVTIPYGETRSYKQIAQMLNNPKACRAVGMANNKNPIWIVIPCHRVIGAGGSLVGYGGGLDMKKKLLDLEKHFS